MSNCPSKILSIYLLKDVLEDKDKVLSWNDSAAPEIHWKKKKQKKREESIIKSIWEQMKE